jgi:hypothetical protein
VISTILLISLRVAAALPSCFVPVVLRMPAWTWASWRSAFMEQGDGSFCSLCRKEIAASLRLMVATLTPPGGELGHVEPDGADGGGQGLKPGLAAPRFRRAGNRTRRPA